MNQSALCFQKEGHEFHGRLFSEKTKLLCMYFPALSLSSRSAEETHLWWQCLCFSEKKKDMLRTTYRFERSEEGAPHMLTVHCF